MNAVQASGEGIVVAALYKFVKLPDYRELQPRLLAFCQAQGLRGTLLLAEEGINGTIAGTRRAVDNVLGWLRSDTRFADLQHKESFTDAPPFLRMKVKLKKEIVTLGVDGIDPTVNVGTYVAPADWNALISDPAVLVVDTRNDYEYSVGTFKNAVNPQTTSFREFPQFVARELDPAQHKKVAMFCTGGIRCEKATAFMLQKGFEQVYHLEGGILKYLEQVPAEQSLWQGDCFVFDERVAVDHALTAGGFDQCHACRHPVSDDDKASELYRPGESCPHCYGHRSAEQIAASRERYRQVQLAEEQGRQHLGNQPPKKT